MKARILFLTFLLFSSISMAQFPGLDWVGVFQSDSITTVNLQDTDSLGNTVVSGLYKGTVDFDFGPGTQNLTNNTSSYETYLAKYDAQKNLIWVKGLGSSQNFGSIADINLAPNGNILVVGNFTQSFQYPGSSSNLTCQGLYDGFVAKLNSQGNLLFVKQISSNNSVLPNKIVTDANQSLIISGNFQGMADFDPAFGTTAYYSATYQDIFILKISALGDFVWVKTFVSPALNTLYPYDLEISNNGALFLNGTFNGTMDFDPNAGQNLITANGIYSNVFILKLSNAGSLSWVKTYYGTDHIGVSGFKVADNGDIFIGGQFSGTADFDPGPNTTYLDMVDVSDGYILKLNSSGDFQWVKQFGGPSQTGIQSLVLDDLGQIYAVGVFQDSLDIDPNGGTQMLYGNGYFDSYVVKFSESGNLIWGFSAGASGLDYFPNIHIDQNNSLYLSGYFQYEVDFDPTTADFLVQSQGPYNGFLWKLNQNQLGLDEKDDKVNIQVFPNPSKGELNIKWEEHDSFHSLTLRNVQGRNMEQHILFPGQHEFKLFTSLPAGVYFAVLTDHDNKEIAIKKWIIH